MKAIEFSNELNKKLKLISHKDRKLFKKIEKQLLLFEENPRHPSLRLHKLKGNLQNVWSISIDRSYRMVYTEQKNSIYFFDIGTHSEIYN